MSLVGYLNKTLITYIILTVGASVIWVITGMIRNRGLLLSNIELIKHADPTCHLSLVVLLNDDDPLADDEYLYLLERLGATTLKLPQEMNSSWSLTQRQVGQLRFAWEHGGLAAQGADILVRSRADLWMTHDYVKWLLGTFALSDTGKQRILTRGVHTSMPFYGEDLLLATGTENADTLMSLNEDRIPIVWRQHTGLMVHFSRFAHLYTEERLINLYVTALSAVEADMRNMCLGNMRWKMALTTLPGGFWLLHQAALQRLAQQGDLRDFLQGIGRVAQDEFFLPPSNISPGYGLDRGSYRATWTPVSPRDIVLAPSTTFIGADAGERAWHQILENLTDEALVGVWSQDPTQELRQPWSDAAVIALERGARRILFGPGRRFRGRLKHLRTYLPQS